MTSINQPSIIAHAAMREHAADLAVAVAEAAVSRQMGHNSHAAWLMDEVIAHAEAIAAIARAERARANIDAIAR